MKPTFICSLGKTMYNKLNRLNKQIVLLYKKKNMFNFYTFLLLYFYILVYTL